MSCLDHGSRCLMAGRHFVFKYRGWLFDQIVGGLKELWSPRKAEKTEEAGKKEDEEESPLILGGAPTARGPSRLRSLFSRRFWRRGHAPPPKEATFLRLAEPQGIAGLTYVEDQTFGVEIEFTSPRGTPDQTGLVFPDLNWMMVAEDIIHTVESVATLPVDSVPRNYHQVADTDRWRVEFDRSAGWEVVSPILRNEEGFIELCRVLTALNAFQGASGRVHINHRTGLHLTLGSGFTKDQQVQGLLRLVQFLEPGLFTLVAPSRLYQFSGGRYSLTRHNRYCRPLRLLNVAPEKLRLSALAGAHRSLRYRTVNLSQVGGEDQHVEVRLHGGTTEYPVVSTWISLWMTILNRAREEGPMVGSRAHVFPAGNVFLDRDRARQEDFFALLDQADLRLDPLLRDQLVRRRAHLLRHWKKAIPRRVRSWQLWWPR